jgi:Rha family phage regulatory protein
VLPLWSDFRVAGFISKKAKHMQLAESDFREMVSVSGDEVVTTSLKVAEYFGKKHKDVLKKIRSVTTDCSVDFSRRNFAPADYIDEQGKLRPMFEITKDGWIMLVMGFTGAQAAAIKEKYIAAFNWMTKKLKVIQDEPTIELMATLMALPAIADQASFHGKGLRKSGLIKKAMIQRIDELSRQLQLPLIE